MIDHEDALDVKALRKVAVAATSGNGYDGQARFDATFNRKRVLALLDALEQAVRRANKWEAEAREEEREHDKTTALMEAALDQRDSARAQRDAAEGKVAAVERLVMEWEDDCCEMGLHPVAVQVLARCARETHTALAPDSADDEEAS